MNVKLIQKELEHAIEPIDRYAPPSSIPLNSASLNPRPEHLPHRHPVLPTIERIATGTPTHVIPQAEAAQVVARIPQMAHHQARIEKLYRNTRIDTRHLAVDLLSSETIALTQQSSIQTRMALYQEQAIPLAIEVTQKALAPGSSSVGGVPAHTDAIALDAIHMIVFVSSTGFIAPGVDTAVIQALGLRRDIARVTINFMGCAAAMNGLRVACDHVRSHPRHKVLVICLELSSINAVFEDQVNDVIIHSIFGDGCAAVLVGACEREAAIGQGHVVIRDHLSYLVERTEDGITLGIKEKGITCQLSRQLPDYIVAGVNPVIEQFLARHGLTKQQIDLWAIHPGGLRIIEGAQRSLGLSDSQVTDSWEVLRQYGNMLSPSVLFVLERMLFTSEASVARDPLTGIAFSFSPGIGIEGVLFQKG